MNGSLNSGSRFYWVKGKWIRKNAVEKLNLMLQVKVNTKREHTVLHKRAYKYKREIQGKTRCKSKAFDLQIPRLNLSRKTYIKVERRILWQKQCFLASLKSAGCRGYEFLA